MPELPDIDLYRHALGSRVVGRTVTAVRIASPFLVRTTAPSPQALVGRTIAGVGRLGKRLVFDADGLFMVIHLMIAGRLQWKAEGAAIPRRLGLMALDVAGGTLLLTEAGTTRRASLYMAADREALAALDPGGLDVLDASLAAFRTALVAERHTLKRTLTDPTIFSGIGNAYSDEILHVAQLSPLRMSDALDESESERLYDAVQEVLRSWRSRLITEAGDAFPAKVTAFRDGMAVHGRYGQPCPRCGRPVQRLRYATSEANYCPHCQTGGRLLADRGLSRLLGKDWPRTLDELEQRKADGQRRPSKLEGPAG